MGNSMILNAQWKSRPDDQRFLTMKELHEFNLTKKKQSAEGTVTLSKLKLFANGEDVYAGFTPEAKQAEASYLNNWAFGQLCQQAKAPASYLRTLPASVAIQPLQYGLGRAEEQSKVLLRKNSKGYGVKSFTSLSYGRIWDADVSGAVLEHVDLNAWKIPAASYAKTDPKRATTLYASDRDVFICLVDDGHPIDIPGKSALYKGFIVGNSEVGAGAFFLLLFYYNRICDNRIIWGFQSALTLRIRHSSGGPRKYMQEAQPALKQYLEAGTKGVLEGVRLARQLEVAKTDQDMLQWVEARGFTQGQAQAAFSIASAEAGLNPRSLWGAVQGLTGHAHTLAHNDDRLDLERRAGALMKYVEAK